MARNLRALSWKAQQKLARSGRLALQIGQKNKRHFGREPPDDRRLPSFFTYDDKSYQWPFGFGEIRKTDVSIS